MIRSWLMLTAAGVPVGLGNLTGMALRKSLSRELVGAIVTAHKAELDISVRELEAQSLAGGRPDDVVQAAIQLRGLDEDVAFRTLAALDLEYGTLPELVGGYARARKLHPDLRFDEVVERLLSGEDVVSAARSGDLRPLARTPGWQVRIEYGPVSADRARELVEGRGPDDAVIAVKRPGGDDWEPDSILSG